MSFYYIERGSDPNVTLPVNIGKHCIKFPVCFQLHNHAQLEILAVLRGVLHVRVDIESFTLYAGDVLVVNPFQLHEGKYTSDEEQPEYYCMTVNMEKAFPYPKSVLSVKAHELNEERGAFDNYYPKGTPSADTLFSLIERSYAVFSEKTPESECEIMSLLFRLFQELFHAHYCVRETTHATRRNLDFMRSVTEYTTEHFREPITTADIAAALYMNTSHFCHSFARHFGSSFTNYLCLYRVTRASLEYLDSRLTVSEIASAVGFSDYGYFSKSFKKYIGVTPAYYFGKWKSK